MKRVAAARRHSANGITKCFYLVAAYVARRLIRSDLIFSQQLVDRNPKRLCQPEDDVAPCEFARPLPVRQRCLRHVHELGQFVLCQVAFLPKMVEPRSIGVAARFWFSAHARMLKAAKKEVAFYQCIAKYSVGNAVQPSAGIISHA